MINVKYEDIKINGESLSIEKIFLHAIEIEAHGKYTVKCNKCNKEVHKLTRINNIMICDKCREV